MDAVRPTIHEYSADEVVKQEESIPTNYQMCLTVIQQIARFRVCVITVAGLLGINLVRQANRDSGAPVYLRCNKGTESPSLCNNAMVVEPMSVTKTDTQGATC
ncbi:hypothetical protein CBL_05309 [Carabus blaptoides fortunei]